MIHQLLDEGIHFFVILPYKATDYCSKNHWANGCKFGFNRHCDATVIERFTFQCDLIVKKAAHGKAECFGTQKVRAVWKNLDIEGFVITAVNIRAEQREPMVDVVDIVLTSML